MDSQGQGGNACSRTVALVYDDRMCQHWNPNDEDHPESPERIRAIWELLESEGIPQRCVVLTAKEVEDKFITSVHTQKHINLIRNISSRGYDFQRNRIASSFNSIYFNEGSSEAAYLAAGSVLEVAERVAKGEFNSAVAIVRPPGHHAEPDKPMGFCLFNNVAIAASYLLNERPELGIKKILIVDWDVHHGNGTQKMFWKDPRVLYFSVHRFDSGSFYPSGDDGSLTMVGEGLGAGYNINVPWEHGGYGDVDYIAVWDYVLIPVARAYDPDIILISGGFDAAINDPLGGCRVTPYGYSIMMKKLMQFAGERIVMALEGGYNLTSLADSVLACVAVLLGDNPILKSYPVPPFESTWRVIRAVREKLRIFWPSLNEELSNQPAINTTLNFDDEADKISALIQQLGPLCDGNHPEDVQDVILSLSKLKVDEETHGKEIDANSFSLHEKASLGSSEECNESLESPYQNVSISSDWRTEFSKINIWYGCFGSNMWKPRFLCYIEGGQVEGMQRSCSGSKDRRLPEAIEWKTVHHRLFFGHSYTRTWGAGGAAFLHPQSNPIDKAYICLYKITLEQFNDILLQENSLVLQEIEESVRDDSPLFDLSSLNSIKSKSMPLDVLKDGWYSNVVRLESDDDLPIFTMTCPLSHIEHFISGKYPLCPPAEAYRNTMVRGLVEGKQLSEEEALEYINSAAARPL